MCIGKVNMVFNNQLQEEIQDKEEFVEEYE
jgi:hypothetical protein